ncbi:efflux transporter, RND family, MFP subunit [Synechococcus sp. PCC 7335]|uniref:efflux RND transporter periplasmic adaptor subunit n=1 Tax=Synechococcus sp. (strain ATCC 29403 / PCC 7335) TaxID=91464 RepID=UPI00017ED590|nr:efflux RND transporter periplasmic adaptor subunit [Synechococcus sp. PCC 7335]EDX87650.1 efflux transporter, RND family, MFP subunit [Synechococcus sp. PCC 7335]
MATTSDSVIGSLKRRPSRKWIAWLGLLLLAGGLGFLFWRVFASRGNPGMQGPPPVAVEVERLESESLQDSAEFVGILDAQAGVSLQPEADGRIVQIFVDSGNTVAAGAPIMQLSSQRSQSDYNAALASVSAARSSRDTARAQLRAARARQTELLADLELRNNDYDRTAALVAQGALPQNQLDEVVRDRTVAESALASSREEIAALEASLTGAEATLEQANANAAATQQDLLDKTVTAPIAGIVGDIPVNLGDYVQAGDQLATITQNQDLDLEIAIPINEADRLRTGLPVELSLFGSDDTIATGAINFISPTTDTDTQTVLAEARFSTPRQPLQDDQRLEVRVIWDERPGILIPSTAITRLGGETFVFVPGEPDPPEEGEDSGPPPGQAGGQADGPPPTVAKLMPVELGSLQGNEYQVLEGLEAGDTIITEGILNLRDGVPIDTSGGSSPPEG